MRRIALAGLGFLIAFCGGQARAQETLSGRPTVLDGDTLRLNGIVVGLFGIAAPGRHQRCEGQNGRADFCGARALAALTERIGQAAVICQTRGSDRHQRVLAICRVDGEDLSAWMAESGHAIADRHRTGDYAAQDTRAWARRRGLWSGVFDDPIERAREDYGAMVKLSAAAR